MRSGTTLHMVLKMKLDNNRNENPFSVISVMLFQMSRHSWQRPVLGKAIRSWWSLQKAFKRDATKVSVNSKGGAKVSGGEETLAAVITVAHH